MSSDSESSNHSFSIFPIEKSEQSPNKEHAVRVLELEKELREVKEQLDEVKEKLQDKDEQFAHIELINEAKCYASTLPTPDSHRKIVLSDGHKYTSEIETFIRHGAAICVSFQILRGRNDNDFVGYPSNFFNELIKYYYETDKPKEIVPDLVIDLSMKKAIPWPAPLIHLLTKELGLTVAPDGKMKEEYIVPTLNEESVDYQEKVARFELQNKHKPDVVFKLRIYFSGDAKCYKQMTAFCVKREI